MKKCGHQSRELPVVNAELSETVGKESLMDFRPKDPIKYLENDQWIDAFVVAYAEPFLEIGFDVKCQGSDRYQIMALDLAQPSAWQAIAPPF